MIKTLIFDFGDVFINLDPVGALKKALQLFKIEALPKKFMTTNKRYELGELTNNEFLSFYLENFPTLTKEMIINAWNYILLDFPIQRLEFIQKLAQEKTYTLILLSNTNALHINWIKNNISFYEEFKKCFDAFYLSYEIHLRKPNTDIFRFVLNKHQLNAEECLFIDDTKENTDAAAHLQIKTWNIQPKNEDITHLFSTKKDLL